MSLAPHARWIPVIAVAVVLGVGPLSVSWVAAQMGAPESVAQEAVALMRDQAGTFVGTVTFREERGLVNMRADLANLTSGFHGFHIHAVGTCDGASGFTTAGGHYNPTSGTHAGHAGDMPSLFVATDGTAALQALLDRVTIAGLLADGGRAVIVHADPDNFGNIPARYGQPDEATLNTGDAGARVACGVIVRP